MKKLIQGIVDFRANRTEESRSLFAKLALGQQPDALFIACSDSRVVPNVFASTNPGDLFVLRNIGNLIPPHDSIQDNSVSAVLEFAIFTLNVADIIVCGHSECGAMNALSKGAAQKQCCPHLSAWLTYGEKSVKKVDEGLILNPELARHNQISQVNVLQQMEHIASYPFIRERLNQKELRLHGLWFDIAHADVYYYEQEPNKFVLLDENEAKLIYERLS